MRAGAGGWGLVDALAEEVGEPGGGGGEVEVGTLAGSTKLPAPPRPVRAYVPVDAVAVCEGGSAGSVGVSSAGAGFCASRS